MGAGGTVGALFLPSVLAWLCVGVVQAQLKGGLFDEEEGYDGFEASLGSPLFQEFPEDGYEGHSVGSGVGGRGESVIQSRKEQDLMAMSSDSEGEEEMDKDLSADVASESITGMQRDVVAVTSGPSGVEDPSPESDSQGDPEQQQSHSRPLLSCGKSSMMLKFSVRRFSRVYLLKGKMPPLLVRSLPKRCGHKVWTTRSWLVLVASYKGCYVRTWRRNQRQYYALTVRYYDKEQRKWVTGTVSCHVPVAPPPPPPRGLTISCSEVCMTVTLPAGPLEEIKVQSSSGSLVSVLDTPSCGYSVTAGQHLNTLSILYTGCHVRLVDHRYTVKVVYVSKDGPRGEIVVSCPYRPYRPREGCKIPRSHQVACGPERLSTAHCLAKGCCVDPETSSCYYPLEECTADRHFVFAVPRTISVPPVDPASLVIAGNASCTPVICTSEFAIFKFPVTGCGTHAFVVGETTIYLAEVETRVRRNIQSYGVITRDSPFRLLVECRYAKGNLASTGYLVKSPYLPSAVLSQGVFGVQLRIATDESYSRFYPQYHRPLRLLLGNPVYLEVRLLNAPDPSLVLLVHYCVAYPRSGQAVWVLLYDGCPNPLDYGHTSTLHIHSKLPLPKHHRRFHIQTFQFLDSTSYSYINEEIYFMCSTELCLPSERQCVEGCFDGRRIPVLENPDADRRCVRTPCPGKDEGPRD
ncbi:zona pellucida sperm-binding protein 4-like [Lepisosteus oculatus]|uniref:zona pellucida sperm-binding protein 4-like n=1 Tax=Lepisosteus oculatus TaxID=7918 RepID=UPI0037189DFA